MNSIRKLLSELTEGDPDFEKELAQAYIRNFEEFRVEAKQAIIGKDPARFKIVVHKIKPSLITLGLGQEVMNLENQENGLTSWGSREADQLIARIEALCDNVLAELNAIVGTD